MERMVLRFDIEGMEEEGAGGDGRRGSDGGRGNKLLLGLARLSKKCVYSRRSTQEDFLNIWPAGCITTWSIWLCYECEP